jgi:hypothetical protein
MLGVSKDLLVSRVGIVDVDDDAEALMLDEGSPRNEMQTQGRNCRTKRSKNKVKFV